MKNRRTFWVVMAGVMVIILGVIGHEVSYTEDAYVKADAVSVASPLSGPVASIYVHNNQSVQKGQLLFELDPTHWQIQLHMAQEHQKQVDEEGVILESQRKIAQLRVQVAREKLDWLQRTEARDQKIYAIQGLSAQSYDDILQKVAVAQGLFVIAQHQLAMLNSKMAQWTTSEALAKLAIAEAEYDVHQTQVRASTHGHLASFKLQPGDQATAGVALFTLISSQGWRVIANFKESDLGEMHVGETAWVSLSTEPWHLFRGEIVGIGRGVARQAQPDGALGYINPAIDWIRYDYRFPVTIRLIHPPQSLYMGSDARVWLL